ncbi:MAG: transcriptional regulator NrdR [Firmicutes bacterium]|nr:transcriptional regulator NrdR [Bacillota bacterium]MCL1944954.1 transcriptional regulator NrdR [Bacillota bacterium]MCL1954235.1 transcriptional regulator NrdR [Bacillota bacterium]
MKCSFCGHLESKVVDTRDNGVDSIRRRRECLSCCKRFTTYEFVDREQFVVVKNNGERRPFDISKVRAGIVKACQKREIPEVKIDELVYNIEQQVFNSLDLEIKSSKIGAIIMEALKQLDSVAYIRFASVYQKFCDVDSFVEFIKSSC